MFPGLGASARRGRAGNAAYSSLVVLGLLGFGALTVDVGHARMVRAQLQNAVDAAAHAAILDVDGTSQGLDLARAAALQVAARNHAGGGQVDLIDGDIVFGDWDPDTGVFTPTMVPEDVDAVVVTHQKLDIDAIFGRAAFGVGTLGAGASSMAVLVPPKPASVVSCYLPIAIPYCRLDGPGIFDFQASSNPADTAGWATLPGDDGTTPNANTLKSQLSGDTCVDAAIGAEASAMNGNAATATATVLERINGGDTATGPWTSGGVTFRPPDAWPVDQWPEQPLAEERITDSDVEIGVFGSWGVSGPVMVVSRDADGDGEDDFCDDDDGDGIPDNPPNWTGTMTLEGFAFAMIYDGRRAGGGMEATLRIRVNTVSMFDDHVLEGDGHAEYGMVLTEGPRLMPAP